MPQPDEDRTVTRHPSETPAVKRQRPLPPDMVHTAKGRHGNKQKSLGLHLGEWAVWVAFVSVTNACVSSRDLLNVGVLGIVGA